MEFILFSPSFLPTFSFAGKKKLNSSRFFLSPKIYLAAATTVLAFFLGHPYALVRFSHFVRATWLLAKTVNETEWHLQPIVPQTISEHIKFNKYVLGFTNLYQAEGFLFSLLIFIGLIWVILRGKKEHLAHTFFSFHLFFLERSVFLAFTATGILSLYLPFILFWPFSACISFLRLLRKRRYLRLRLSFLLW